FRRRFVPDLERKMVVSVEPAPHGFDLVLENEEVVAARRVVVASGIRSFDYIPAELRGLPPELLTHGVAYGDAHHLSGRDVIVVGAGASAMDIAALLRARGATPSVMTRRQGIRFQSPLGARSVYEKIVAPMTPLGPGWKSVLCVRAPMVFHAMPEAFRVDVVRRYLGPAPAWSRNFESSVPDLYFVGTAAANSFGPMMRFAHGAAFTSRRLSQHLVGRSPRSTVLAAKLNSNVEAQRQMQ